MSEEGEDAVTITGKGGLSRLSSYLHGSSLTEAKVLESTLIGASSILLTPALLRTEALTHILPRIGRSDGRV